MKILFIYSTLAFGGVESVIRDRMYGLQKHGIETKALFLKDKGGMPLFIPFDKRVEIASNIQSQVRLISEFNPDWIINFDTPEMIPIVKTNHPNIKQIYEIHTTIKTNLERAADKSLLAMVDALIVPSQAQLRKAQRVIKTRQPMYVLPNGIPDDFYQRINDHSSTKGPIVLWVGRLEKQKGWKEFIQIASRVGNAHPNSNFWMVGGQHSIPEQHMILWDLIKKSKLVTTFRWFPEVPRREIPRLMQWSAESGGCFVSTSEDESFGLSVLEAMACGCPVVVPKLDALVELVDDGTEGYIYEPGNLDQAVKSITSLLEEEELQKRFSKAAIVRSMNYSLDKTALKFLEILSIIENNHV